MADTPREVLVYKCQGELELQLARDLLNRHGIPNRYQGEALRLTHGFTADGLALVRIYVPAEHSQRAIELLAALEGGELALEEGDGPATEVARKDWKNLP
jgi:hypothetical protein